MSKVKYLFVVTANLISLQKLHVIPQKKSYIHSTIIFLYGITQQYKHENLYLYNCKFKPKHCVCICRQASSRRIAIALFMMVLVFIFTVVLAMVDTVNSKYTKVLKQCS